MTERLPVGENEKYEDVRRRFDEQLGVAGWTVPGQKVREPAAREPGAPLWWVDEEEASASFMKSMGVVLDG